MNDKLLLTFLLTVPTLFVVSVGNGRAADVEKPREPAQIQLIDFVRDVQPIFEKSCLPCHGPDKQKSDFRLDVRESALKGGESYAPNIVQGQSADSPLIQFITGTGDITMPPEGERLSAKDVEIIRLWIDQGAVWPDEVAGRIRDKSDLWSLKPLIKPEIPIDPSRNGRRGQPSPIDAFIRSKLAEHQFASTQEADRRTLIRRVSFDLIGLPPSPEDVVQFVDDPDPKAYEKLVDRLLASPRYGERWARHWLDTAHFAETHGHDQDRIREHAWPYRDYLIEAFNTDKPYSRFIQEQIAGDALFEDDPSATVALGFLAAGPWDESSLRDILEDTIDRQVARYLDRDDMLATVINNICSLTVHCARCHDHKFDPISQNDYYSLQAIFSGVERANRKYDADPDIHHQRRDLARRKRNIEQRSADEVSRLLSNDVQQKVVRWEQSLSAQEANWSVINVASFSSSDGAILSQLEDGSILSGGPRPDKDTVTIVSAPLESIVSAPTANWNRANEKCSTSDADRTDPDISQITAIRLEVIADPSLPQSGPGRQDNGNLHLSEFEVYVDGCDNRLGFVSSFADFNQSGWDIAKSIDQNESTAWGIDPQEGRSHRAIFQLKEPIALRVGDAPNPCSSKSNPEKDVHQPQKHLRFVLKQLHGRGHLIGRMRICVTDSERPAGNDPLPETIVLILAVPADQRSDTQRLELAAFQQLAEINRELSALPSPRLVYAAAADFEPDGSMKPPPGPRPIHVLHRGDIRQPREATTPGALECVTVLPARFEIPAGAPESQRRAALARWLTHVDNPFPWRSLVNRVWHHHFGRGIVGTLNDFGHMGETPSHPELLDWLALEFRDSGQSFKQLHRSILNSETYRQKVENPATGSDQSDNDQRGKDDRLVLDADNRLLWRMNRTRLDAECIRDAVLAISGRLDLRMGGPSDRQFDLQPGIHVTPRVDYTKFDPSSDLGRRRSIYRFLFRTLPDPFMDSLDCPSGDQMTPARNNSVTVQQALALWNDIFILQHCEHIASRIENEIASAEKPEGQDATSQEVRRAFQLILCRDPSNPETIDVTDFTHQHGLANLCRLLLNSNEFLFVN